MELREVSCCGIREFNGLNNPNEVIINYVAEDRFYEDYDCGKKFITDSERYRYVIFSDVSSGQQRMKKLTQFIKENKLGVTVKTKPRINPNSRNILQVCVWTINDAQLKKWYKKYCI